MRFRLENRSGYDTEDLRRFFEKGFKALVRRSHPLSKKTLDLVVVSSPIRSRGCAEVGGHRMVIAIAPRSKFSLRRLARLLHHETGHLLGLEHEDMNERLLYSLGPTPGWAVGSRIRYRGRAPDQIVLLRRKPR